MDTEFLIKDEAKKFKRNLEFGPKPGRHLEVKDDLEETLTQFDDNIDKLIFLYQISINIDELLERHNIYCKDPENCAENIYYAKLKYFTEQLIRRLNPSFEFTLIHPHVNSSLVQQNLIDLDRFPRSAVVYLSAMDKINQKSYQRNLLDDLRLSMELLLKEILQNDESLENQQQDLGRYLKLQSVSPEVINMFLPLKDYFEKYQNSYVKHDDNVNINEIELMINLTSTFISFLVNVK